MAVPLLAERLAAIGPIAGLPDALRRALDPRDDFAPIPTPGPHDWLANHRESGQTYEQFVRSRPHRPDSRRHTIYLQPLGDFETGDAPPLDPLREFAAAFFTMEVDVLPAVDLAASRIAQRRLPHSPRIQLLTGDVLALLRQRLPGDAYAVLGITMEDLYPDPSWNFVFGQASLRHRVGIYSFARYDPRFFGDPLPADWRLLLLRRSCKVMVHETAHMFGLAHCIFFRCLMNGSNHLAESDARPLHLCPVDLRKLQDSVGFDVAVRYRRLRDFCERVGFDDEAQWLSRRLAYITSDASEHNAEQ